MMITLTVLMVTMFVFGVYEHIQAYKWQKYAEQVMRQEQETLCREQRGLETIRIFTKDTERLFIELRAECEKVRAERDAAVAELQRVTHGKT